MATIAQACTQFELLQEKIHSRSAQAGIIGLGYVGLPLAIEFAKAGFHVTGIDIDPSRIARIRSGDSYVMDVQPSEVQRLVQREMLTATTDFGALSVLDTINICVPTPLQKSKDPDMSYIDAVCREIVQYIHPGLLIVLESTTYPGTTEEVIRPALEKTGLRVGEDIFLCFSPERVDPGNPAYNTANIPKVVGGITPRCTQLGSMFYSTSIQKVVPVSSPRVAEMVKLLENTFRMINIGLANEMAMMCDRMAIDVWEVIDAAATKPFGFMPFYPGPGLGGHCIPIDPFYLSWKSRQNGMEARFIELAGYINGQMPRVVVDKIQNALNEHRKPLRNSTVHIMGVAYKRNTDDSRESPAFDIMHILKKRGAHLSYSDPFVKNISVDGARFAASPESCAAEADCTVIVTDHAFDYHRLVECSKLVVDTRNALKGWVSEKIVRL